MYSLPTNIHWRKRFHCIVLIWSISIYRTWLRNKTGYVCEYELNWSALPLYMCVPLCNSLCTWFHVVVIIVNRLFFTIPQFCACYRWDVHIFMCFWFMWHFSPILDIMWHSTSTCGTLRQIFFSRNRWKLKAKKKKKALRISSSISIINNTWFCGPQWIRLIWQYELTSKLSKFPHSMCSITCTHIKTAHTTVP